MYSALLLGLSLPSFNAFADIQPRNASLNYSQKSLSNAGNPAAAALIVKRKDPHVMTGGSIEFGAGIEYGGLDELFTKIDKLSAQFNPPKDDQPSSEPQLPTPENPDRDYQWMDLFEKYPELEDRLDMVKKQVASTAGIVALVATEGYGKAEARGDANFVLNENLWGGTLLLGASYKGNAKALGIFDDFNLDAEQAKTELAKIPGFTEDDPIQELDLSGGITLLYNPANQKVKFTFDNDSLLLIKATKIAQVSLAYSKHALAFKQGDLYWGAKPTFYRVGLTNVSTRMGEVTDSESLFDDINNADFRYENGFDLDLGVVWAAKHYQLGAAVSNIIENSYNFPDIELRKFSSAKVLKQISFHQKFTMQRQVKLEVGIYTAQRNWSLNAEIDANPVVDPMRDRYQWLTVTGGYAADSWWLPSARLGFSRNLAGSQLAYLNAGVTVMKFFNIDLATTLDTVTLDGNEMRRGASINFGVQFDY